MNQNENFGLIVCTTGVRKSQLTRCLDSHYKSAEKYGVQLVDSIYLDTKPSPYLHHLVEVRNVAFNRCKERWAFICDDDDIVFEKHIGVLLATRCNYPKATVIMGQSQDKDGKILGFTLSCSLINLDRFQMVDWLCPPEGGEDFYTLSTLEARGHLIVREPTITWQVCNDTPSLTRNERVELVNVVKSSL